MKREQIEILLGDTSLGKNFARILRNTRELHVDVCKKDGDVIWSEIQKNNPTVVMLDKDLPGMHTPEIIEKSGKLPGAPAFLVTYKEKYFSWDTFPKKAGAVIFLQKPFDFMQVARYIDWLAFYRIPEEKRTKEERMLLLAIELFHLLRIPFYSKGYQYLRDAVLLCTMNPRYLISASTQIYAVVADRFAETSAKVERLTKHVLKLAWKQGCFDAIGNDQNDISHPVQEIPSDFVLFRLLSDKLKWEYERLYGEL